MKTEWIKLKPSEFYHMVMDNNVGEKRYLTKVGYNFYKVYCFRNTQIVISLYTNFESNIPEEISKDELTKHFKYILRRDKLEKIRSKI